MKTAVITLAVGKSGQEMHEVSKASQQAYAARIGAEYAVIGDATMPYPLGEKWRLSKLAIPYDRVIYLDADIVVRPDACNLFDLVPEGKVGLFDEWGYMPDVGWIHAEYAQLQREQGLPERMPPGRYYNTGLVVFDRQQANIFAPPTKPFTPFFCAEQHFINFRLDALGYDVFDLGPDVHWEWWIDKEGTRKDRGQFLHFAGLRDHQLRLAEMKAVANVKEPTRQVVGKAGCGCSKTKEIRDRLKELKGVAS